MLLATSLTATTAVLNGTVNANGGSATVSFDYGLDSSYGTNVAGTPATVTGSSATAVSTTLTGLTPGTTYHCRANGASNSGTASGTDLSFTTLDNNASLASLTLSGGTFAPAFSSAVLTYAVAVPKDTTTFTLTPTTSSSNATITVNSTAATSGVATAPITLSGDSATINVVVTAQDGTTVKTYTLNLTRNTLYLDWAATNSLSGPKSGPDQDFDDDGISNLIEYAVNSDPRLRSKGVLPTGGSSLNAADGKHYFVYAYRRRIIPGTLTYTLESSASLGSWTAIPVQNLEQIGAATPTGDGVTETVTFRISPSINDTPRANFVRLKVSP